ncbi:NAD(P)-dependent alcohol dehydrogenase [Candidatus Thorarchaeota archaeon]|nr:MAG: NAD(P)-dependent alcohol dehydrogenase [Candidatus Thorarchaeota archaeon]
MKAAIIRKFGPPNVLVLEEIEKPSIQDNQVLVKVHATSVNAMDYRTRSANVPLWPFGRLMMGLKPSEEEILGNEVAGEIVEVGSNVTKFKKGDRIFGCVNRSYAEYVVSTENATITSMPPGMSYEEGASIGFGGITSLHFLRTLANIQKGQRVLINGASGGVGVYAVQLAKYFGAEVTGVCSTKNIELVKLLGADRVIDYTTTDFTKEEEVYDIIFDAVGKSSFSKCKKPLREDGIYLSTVPSYRLLMQMLWTSKIGKKKAIFAIASGPENLIFLKELLESNDLRVVIDRTYPFEQIAEAHAYADKGHKVGSVAISVYPKEVIR